MPVLPPPPPGYVAVTRSGKVLTDLCLDKAGGVVHDEEDPVVAHRSVRSCFVVACCIAVAAALVAVACIALSIMTGVFAAGFSVVGSLALVALAASTEETITISPLSGTVVTHTEVRFLNRATLGDDFHGVIAGATAGPSARPVLPTKTVETVEHTALLINGAGQSDLTAAPVAFRRGCGPWGALAVRAAFFNTTDGVASRHRMVRVSRNACCSMAPAHAAAVAAFLGGPTPAACLGHEQGMEFWRRYALAIRAAGLS